MFQKQIIIPLLFLLRNKVYTLFLSSSKVSLLHQNTAFHEGSGRATNLPKGCSGQYVQCMYISWGCTYFPLPKLRATPAPPRCIHKNNSAKSSSPSSSSSSFSPPPHPFLLGLGSAHKLLHSGWRVEQQTLSACQRCGAMWRSYVLKNPLQAHLKSTTFFT